MDWDNSLSVEIPEFDQAHQKLIGMINELHGAMKQGKSREVITTLMTGLKSYTLDHFSQEEGFMKKHEYSDLAAHENAHKKFVEKILGFEKDAEAGKLTVAVDLLNFLNTWLVEHIKETDKKYGVELIGKPV